MFYPSFFKRHRWFRKGHFKYLVLYVLRERALNGYEISKAIKELFKDIYEPSPGVLYPTLRYLELKGLIRSVHRNGKKLYEITEKGKSIIADKEGEIEERLAEVSEHIGGDVAILLRSIRSLMRTLFIYYPDMDSEKISKISSILKQARNDIIKLFEEG